MSKYILSIDQGTTGTTVSVINSLGFLKSKVNLEFDQHYPRPGWVEHDPDQIWDTVVFGIKKSLEQAGVQGKSIAAIGITNQRETIVAWSSRTQEVVFPAIVWQCRRTTSFCESLKKRKGIEASIRRKTGLVIDPYFSSTKIHWMLQNVKEAKRLSKKGELKVGTIDSFLLWRLTGGTVHRTDVSNASRTQLMNIRTGKWDKDLLKLFNIDEEMLPEICPSSGLLGLTKGVPGLPDGVPISGMAGDQQAALFGQACFRKGEAKCTYGTGSFILLNTGDRPVFSRKGMLTTIAWQLRKQKKMTYAMEGGAFICGAAVQWLRDGLHFFEESKDIEALAASVESTEGVQVVPAFTGLGAPYWDPEARGLICGITRGTTRAHIARATLEAMAWQNVDIIEAMEKEARQRIKSLKVDGGASANNLLMQMQSDFLGSATVRPKTIETTVAGAAFLAGLGVGFWSSLSEIKKIWQKDASFRPRLSQALRKEKKALWQAAIRKALLKK